MSAALSINVGVALMALNFLLGMINYTLSHFAKEQSLKALCRADAALHLAVAAGLAGLLPHG